MARYRYTLWSHATCQMYVEILFLMLNVKSPPVFVWEQSLNLAISDLYTVCCFLQIKAFREFCQQLERTCLHFLLSPCPCDEVPVMAVPGICSSALLIDIVTDRGKDCISYREVT